jgi:hypothetical protein
MLPALKVNVRWLREEGSVWPHRWLSLRGEAPPMSEYLDQLIRTLQAEADEGREALDRSRAKGLRETKHAGRQLRRTLQRLEILESLRASQAAKFHIHIQAMRRPGRKAARSRRDLAI